MAKVGARAIVTGTHRYTADLRPSGMLYGRVLRAPAYGAALASLDAAAAVAIKGVRVVHEGDFAGVAAPDPATAARALGGAQARVEARPAAALQP